MRYASGGFLLGAGSPSGSDTETSTLGIVQGHAYALLDVREIDGHRLLKLRNPWGRVEWKGDWSARSPLWTARMRTRLQEQNQGNSGNGGSGSGSRSADAVDGGSGVFWMCLADFVQHFARLYVCKLPSAGWQEVILRSEWKGRSAGGCSNHRTWALNPSFKLEIFRPTHVLVALAQDVGGGGGRGCDDVERFCIGMQMLTAGRFGMRVPAADSGAFINAREVSFDVQLEMASGAQATSFTLRPSTFEPGQECGFTLRVYSEHPCVVEELAPRA